MSHNHGCLIVKGDIGAKIYLDAITIEVEIVPMAVYHDSFILSVSGCLYKNVSYCNILFNKVR